MHNLLGVDFWITSANLLYLASYSVRDILWLRVLTVVAAVLLIPYYFLQASPLWMAIGWNVLFTGINVFWILRLLRQRRPVPLSDDETRLRQLCLSRLGAGDVAKLCSLGTWEDLKSGTCLVEHDRSQRRLSVILSGRAEVWIDGKGVAELDAGDFVGQIAYVVGEKAPISVVAMGPMRILTWPRAALEAFLKDRPDVELLLRQSLSTDLMRMLMSAWQSSTQRGPQESSHDRRSST